MKKTKKLLAALFCVVMLVSCMTTSVFAAETGTQDGLNAVIQTDKESYAANEDIQITVTVTNTNTFEVKNVSIESLLPDALTLKDGDLKSKTVDLQPGETLSISCVVLLEKEPSSVIDPTTTEPITEAPDTTDEPTTAEPTTIPATTMPTTETPATTEQTETTTDGGAILPVEPSTIEPTTVEPTSAISTQSDTPDNPDTGSGSTIVKALLITVIAAAVVVAIVVITKKNNKKATKVISLVLCGAIVISSFATIGFIKVGAEENNTRNFTVDKTITVDGQDITVSAKIHYSDESNADKELDTIKNINNGVLPDITMDDIYDIPSFIHGKYTEDIISSGQDAINSLQDVQHLLKIKNPQTEFECIEESGILDTNYYRLQQYYNGIKVEGSQIVVATDNGGHSESLTSSYVPLDFELKPIAVSEEQAKEIVLKDFEKEGSAEISEVVLCRDKMSGNYIQAYKILGNGFKNDEFITGIYIVSAISGEIINFNSFLKLSTVSASGLDNNNVRRDFEVEKINDNLYYLADFSKNIAVYDAGNKQVSYKTITKSDGTFTFEVYWNNTWVPTSWFSKAAVVQDKNNKWNDSEAVSLYANLWDTYNYYLTNLERKGFDDKNGEVFAVYNDHHGWDWTNAHSYGSKSVDMTLLTFGKDNPLELDTVAHEYTHSVQMSIVNLPYEGESGAIMEAYADIMGEIVQNDSSWIQGERVLSNPNINRYPSYYRGTYWIDVNDDDDNGGVHTNSTVLSHAAYLMNQKGISMSELGKIFYQSMKYYADSDYYGTVNINFNDFREAVVEASRQVNEKNTNIVEAAFDEVGVFGNPMGTITGTVKDEVTGAPISGVKVYIEEDGVQTRSCYTNENGGFELALPVGHHLIHYSHENYEHAMNGFDIEKDATTVIMEPVYLTPKDTENPGFAGGDGTIENPYQVSTPEQLNAVRNDLDAHYIQINDIDLSDYDNWEPIGNEEAPFQGTFDGKNHIIKNMKIDFANDLNCFGLFGVASSIKNVQLVDCNIDLKEDIFNNKEVYIGSVTGKITKNLSGCSAIGKIEIRNVYSYFYVGGLAGSTDYSDIAVDIDSCINQMNIEVFDDAACIGGIIGAVFDSGSPTVTINNCLNKADISNDIMIVEDKPSHIGGIAGQVYRTTISQCQNTGSIFYEPNASWGNAGGILGDGTASNIHYCINYGDISSEEDVHTVSIAGIVASTNIGHEILSCVNYGNLSSSQNATVAGIAIIGGSLSDGGPVSNCFNMCKTISGKTAARITIDRLDNYYEVNDNYSINVCSVNGVIPTEDTQADQMNGASLTKEEMEEKIAQIDFGNMPT